VIRYVLPGGALALAAGLLAGCGANADVEKLGAKATDYYCAPDQKGAAAIEAALRSSDEDDYNDAIRFAVEIPPGTSVRVEQRVAGDHPQVRVAVLDGEQKGRECWYADGVDGLFTK
jgi:outer membrane murein-binding lipoprotein Lpp